MLLNGWLGLGFSVLAAKMLLSDHRIIIGILQVAVCLYDHLYDVATCHFDLKQS